MNVAAVKGRVMRWVQEAKQTRPVRAVMRYSSERATLLAGGMAYISLLTVGSTLVVGFTAMNAVVAGNERLREQVVQEVARQLPGLLTVDGEQGLVTPEQLFATDVWSVAGVVSLLLALWSGANWLNAVREGVRAIWRLEPQHDFYVLKKVRDVGFMGVIGALVVASAALSLVVNSAAGRLLAWMGAASSAAGQVVLQVLAAALVLALDTVMLVVLFRLVTAIKMPWQILVQGAVAGAVGFGLLKIFAGQLLAGVGGNPVLAGSAVLVGLAVWLNFNARVTLAAAAWAAESAYDAGVPELGDAPVKAVLQGPRPPDHPVPIGPAPPEAVPVGRRMRDTVSLGAGVVIGAAFLSGVRMLRAVQARSSRPYEEE